MEMFLVTAIVFLYFAGGVIVYIAIADEIKYGNHYYYFEFPQAVLWLTVLFWPIALITGLACLIKEKRKD